MQRRRFLAASGTSLATLSGCLRFEQSNNDRTTGTGGTASDTVREVQVGPEGKYKFSPKRIVVEPGTTVHWRWLSDGHNIKVASTPDGATWKGVSEFRSEGATYSKTFEERGVYEYYCQEHKALGGRGSVVVGNVTQTTIPKEGHIGRVGTNWRQHGRGARKWSYLDASGPADLAVNWTREFAKGEGLSNQAPLLADGTLFTNSDYRLRALNAQTGETIWSHRTESGTFTNFSPAIHNGVLYIGNSTGIQAYSISDGSKKWETSVDGSKSTISITDDVLAFPLYPQNQDYRIVGLDPSDGTILWQTHVDFPTSGVSIDNNKVYVPTQSPELLALDVENGNVEWRYTPKTGPNTPILDNGELYSLDGWGNLYALSADDGSELWTVSDQNATSHKPAFNGSLLIYTALKKNENNGSDTAYVRARDTKSGSLKWETRAGESNLGDPVVTEDGSTYVTSGDSILHVDGNGELVETLKIEDGLNEFIVSDAGLFGTGVSTLYGVGTR